MIDLSAPARWLRGPTRASRAFVAAAAILAVSGSYVVAHPPPAVHTILAGVNAYPSDAVAAWRDPTGLLHLLDPYTGDTIHVPARSALIVVTAPVHCSLVVDGVTMDETRDGQHNVCQWTA